ncbi:reverse transcriptase [Phytophthora megakarya]|uniref:Reverse transcriptase n=1 Tax=Phytophthora megakarya TaxID=4795 RepID=A0A225WX68_9STRA|nr:reverse transcriptase [Phytophthora megakarya]
MLAGQAPKRLGDKNIYSAGELEDLRTLNRLGEVVHPTTRDANAASTHQELRRTIQTTPSGRILKELEVQRLRPDRVRTAQEENTWIANLNKFLDGDISELSKREAKNSAKLAEQYRVGGVVYCIPRTWERDREHRDTIMKLVVPKTLRGDV